MSPLRRLLDRYRDLDDEWVGLIWEHSVLPYVAEQLFDEPGRLEEFDLGRLRGRGGKVEKEIS